MDRTTKKTFIPSENITGETPKPKNTVWKWTLRVGVSALLLGIVSVLALGTLSWVGYQPTQINKDILKNNPQTIVNRADYISFLGQPQTPEKLLLFYPGAAVSPISYVNILSQLSSSYRYILLVKFPLNLAVVDPSKGDKIIQEFQKDFALPDSQISQIPIYLSGHSLGGVMTSEYYKNSTHKSQIRGVIYFAAYPSSTIFKENGIPSLVLYGEYDGVLAKSKLIDTFKDDSKSEVIQIDGMNHAQWGDYGDQLGDRRPYITSQQAQIEAVQKIKTWSELDR